MKLSKTEWRLWFFFCNLLIVFVGVFAIYYVECRINMNSRQLAQKATEDLIKNYCNEHSGHYLQTLPESELELQNADQYLTYSVLFEADGKTRPLRIYYGQREKPFSQWIAGFRRLGRNDKAFFTVQGFLHPVEMVSIAGNPVVREGTFVGMVYVVKVLDYAMLLCILYAIISTVLYSLIVHVILTQRKSRIMVEQIYHQYIANISHELKSPIASISAITETLSEGLVEDELTTSRYYGIILREAKLLEHSVMQIIDLSKLQDARNTFEKTEITPGELFEPVYERFSARCEEIGITFYIEDSIWNLPVLYTDGFRMTQLLEILLDNACKFVADDGTIFINATTKYGQATIRVNDNGRGISGEDLPHVFERFYKTSIDNPTGTGLGLAIAQEIARGLEEEIWVQSEEGVGTIFFVTVSLKT
ncbi:MAG: HAMP domain-containing histidine kinase [Eubacterium sp.]|nr:HAMP domain-containing histidine kinase [Eubacterium sp.]